MFSQHRESEARGSPAPWITHLFKIRRAIQTVFPGFCNTRQESVMRSWAAWATAAAAALLSVLPPHTHCLASCAQAFSLTWILTCTWGPAPWPQKKSVAWGLKVCVGVGRTSLESQESEASPHYHMHTAPWKVHTTPHHTNTCTLHMEGAHHHTHTVLSKGHFLN